MKVKKTLEQAVNKSIAVITRVVICIVCQYFMGATVAYADQNALERIAEIQRQIPKVVNDTSLPEAERRKRHGALIKEMMALQMNVARDRAAAENPQYKSTKELSPHEKNVQNLFVRKEKKKTVLVANQGVGNLDLKGKKIGQPYEAASQMLLSDGYSYNRTRGYQDF